MRRCRCAVPAHTPLRGHKCNDKAFTACSYAVVLGSQVRGSSGCAWAQRYGGFQRAEGAG